MAVIACFTIPAHADSEKAIKVVTENGVTLTLTEIEYGAIAVKSGGEKQQYGVDDFGSPIYQYQSRELEFDGKSRLPSVIGGSFGIRFRLPTIPENDRVVLDVETILPDEVLINGDMIDKTIDSVILTPESSGSRKSIHWTLYPDNTAFHQTGSWQIILHNADSRVYQKKLQLY